MQEINMCPYCGLIPLLGVRMFFINRYKLQFRMRLGWMKIGKECGH